MSDLDLFDDWDHERSLAKKKAAFVIGICFNMGSQGNIPANLKSSRDLVACVGSFADCVFDHVDKVMQGADAQ
jgi:hypothetical protein